MGTISLISLENYKNKGIKIGDTLVARSGYARYLIAQGKAVKNSAESRAQFDQMRASLEQRELEALKLAETRAKAIIELSTITIASRAADESRLYGSLGPREVAQAITATGNKVEKREVHLPSGPIRHLGEHTVHLQLHHEITVTLNIQVIPQK